jgi:hypothetical protein
VLPAATERPSRRLASSVRAAYFALPIPARDVVLRSPARAGPTSGHRPGLRAALLDAGAVPAVVDDYLAADRAAAAYATQVLRASAARGSGPDRFAYVQVNIVRREVAPYGTDDEPDSTELTVGARPAVRMPGQDDAAFGATWDALRNDADPGGRAR